MKNILVKKGFTLVETLVAILALSLSLGALTVIGSRSLTSARDAELRIQAEMLAVEGVEIIEQKLISRSIGSTTPIGFLSACVNGCGVSYSDIASGTDPATYACPSGNCANVERIYNNASVSGLPVDFGRTGAVLSPFRRVVYVQPAATGTGYDIRAVVKYSPISAAVQKSVVLTKQYQSWYTAP